MYPGYLALGGVPIVDNAMAKRLAKQAGIGGFWKCAPCPAPGSDMLADPPWWDKAVPASKEFLGFWCLEMTGIDRAPFERSVTRLAHAGSALGPLRIGEREIGLKLRALAASDAGMSYGMSWLAWQMSNSDRNPDTSCGGCAGSTARILAYCPDPSASAQEQRRAYLTLYDVGLLDWPSSPEYRYLSTGACEGSGRPVTAEFEIVLVAGRPWLYAEPVTLADQMGFVTPTRWPCQGWVAHQPGVTGNPIDCTISVMDECVQWTPADSGMCTIAASCNTSRSNVLGPDQSTGTGTTTLGWDLYLAERTLIDDDMSDPERWTAAYGPVPERVDDGRAPAGTALEWKAWAVAESKTKVAYDGKALYKVEAWLKTSVKPSDRDNVFHTGLAGHDEKGDWCNTVGQNAYSRQHYCAASGRLDASSEYRKFTGYLRGWAEQGTSGPSADPNSPGQMHKNVRTIGLLSYVLYQSTATDGAARIGRFRVAAIPNPAKMAIREGRIGVVGASAGAVVQWKHPTMPGWPVRPGHAVDFHSELGKAPDAIAQIMFKDADGNNVGSATGQPGTGTVSGTAPAGAVYAMPEVILRAKVPDWQPVGKAELLAVPPSPLPGASCDPDPSAPVHTAPPMLPVPTDPAACIATLTPAYATTGKATPVMSTHTRFAPTITITTGAKPARKLSIRIYRSKPGATCTPETLDECDLAATFGVPYLGAGTTLVMDGRAGCITKTCADGSVDENVPVYNDAGRPIRELPTFSAAEAWCVVAVADRGSIVDPEAVTAIVDVSASAIWEAA